MNKLKKLLIILMVIGVIASGASVSYGANDPVQYGETEQELARAENRLNQGILEFKEKELKEITSFNESKIIDKTLKQIVKQKKGEQINSLRNLKSYRDFKTDESVDMAIKNLQERGYPIDVDFSTLSKEIETYKKTHFLDDPKKIVKHFNASAGLMEKRGEREKFIFSLVAIAHALSYSEWTKLTASEKLLIASNPVAALKTNSIKQLAYNYTTEKFGSNGLGDKTDGYRHGIWSALMTRSISRAWAEAYGTAHEDRQQTELSSRQSDGYYGWQHKGMDLANNKVGRDSIAWYEYWFNCSDSTVKSRISGKLTNMPGDITWLHN